MRIGLEFTDSVLSDAEALSAARCFLLEQGFDEPVINALLGGTEVHLAVTSEQLAACAARKMILHFPVHFTGDPEELHRCILRRAHPLAKAHGFEVDDAGAIELDPNLGGAWVSGRFFVKYPLPT